MVKLFKFSPNLMVFLCSALLILIPRNVLGQTAPVPVRDPNAATLASQTLHAMAGGTAISDITMVGSATYIAGSDQETVSIVLMGLGTTSSSVKLNLASGPVTEVRNYSTAARSAAWIDQDGTAHPIALHNCWTEAVWFFPALGVLTQMNDPQLSFAYVGAETHYGVPVQHVRTYRVMTTQGPDVIETIQKLSTVDVYLDPSSLLPEFVTFSTHPDDNFNIAIPVEIDFADYRSVGNAHLPFHIRRFEAGVLKLDVVVASATLNSGLSPAAFAIP